MSSGTPLCCAQCAGGSITSHELGGRRCKSLPRFVEPLRTPAQLIQAASIPVGDSDPSAEGAMKQTILLSGLCAGLLCGCADVRITEYQRPDAPAKSSWSRQPEVMVSASATISPQWWTQFGDPALD